MSELSRMARPLLERPVVAAPSVAELRRRGQRRRRRHLIGGGATSVVVLAVVALVVGLVPAAPRTPTGSAPSSLTAYVRAGVSVPDATLDTVGLPPTVTPPASVTGGAALTDDGRPAVVFVGAGYCPYCALERWALLVALSRFGTFSNLGRTVTSSSTDVYPGLQSWSFAGSDFASSSLTFDPAEIYSSTPNASHDGYEPEQSLSSLQRQAFDVDPGGAMPFVDIGGRFVATGASSSPAVLEGLSLDQVADQLADPSSAVAQAVDGSADYLVAAICSVTGAVPAAVCGTPWVTAAQATMASHPYTAAAASGR
ncbi:MAG: DUF929 family protein [Acidimicrobiales bacterium]|jgi:hypothetical protein